ncbi:MmcQ/YjbR family DNA-binding protein [uncultured Caulobacter sp.]|uniref:MmcQ/YjbR family DNA-binding protein n=1 Tax=uncultured Caulobacter sp. TaxID=158749 RepID=UPI002629A267|nr:MmcQ/YjbR family DNA-binding protein [uncultured Caulobacter sp.]
MTPDDFTTLALDLGPNVQSKAILETVQFRVSGKAFATLGWPTAGWAVVKVAPSRQAWALSLSDGVAPEPGRRRKAGIVLARLAAIDETVAAELLAAAWSFAHGPSARRGRATALVTSVASLSAEAI